MGKYSHFSFFTTGFNEAILRIKTFIEERLHFSLSYLNLSNLSRLNEEYGYNCGDLAIDLIPKITKDVFDSSGKWAELYHLQQDEFLLFSNKIQDKTIFLKILQKFEVNKEEIIKNYHILNLRITAIDVAPNDSYHPLKLWDILKRGDKYLKNYRISNFLLIDTPLLEFLYIVNENRYIIVEHKLWNRKLKVEDRVFPLVPSVLELKDDIQRLFKHQSKIGVISFFCKWLKKSRLLYNDWWENKYLTERITSIFRQLQGKIFRHQDIISIHHKEPNILFLFLSHPRQRRYLSIEELDNIATRIKDNLAQILLEELGEYDYQSLGLFSFETLLDRGSEYMLLDKLEYLKDMAYRREDMEVSLKLDKLKELLEDKELNILLQPIFCSTKSEIVGYEALLRGNLNMSNPEYILYLATKAGVIPTLERNIIKSSVNTFLSYVGKRNWIKLFINISPESLQEVWFQDEKFLDSLPLSCRRIVFEISYNNALFNPYLFLQGLNTLKRLGITIAIDDFPLDSQDFSLILDIPNYIKFDLRTVSKGTIKFTPDLQLLRNLSKSMKKQGILTLLECIDDKSWYNCAVTAGIDFLQGYLLGEPKALNQKL